MVNLNMNSNWWSFFGMARPSFHVELIGGPFDGEFRDAKDLETRLSLPVLRETSDESAIEETSTESISSVTSIAIYILAVKDGRWVYGFLRSMRSHSAISDDMATEL